MFVVGQILSRLLDRVTNKVRSLGLYMDDIAISIVLIIIMLCLVGVVIRVILR